MTILLTIAVSILLFYKFQHSDFAPIISKEEARNLPEFNPNGRSRYFDDENPIGFWISNGRSGMFARLSQMPWPNGLAVLLPFFVYFKHKLPHIKKENLAILGKIILVSFGLYFLAHITLFELYLPSRYTTRTFRLIIDISGALVVYLLIQTSFNYLQKFSNIYIKKILPVIVSCLLIVPIILYPSFLSNFPKGNYVIGQRPQIYQFFAQQPKDILVASLATEADNISSFSARSVLVSREHSIPYHNGYYLNKLRSKIIDTIKAQYTTDLFELQEFINKYQIDFWLIQKNSFTEQYLQKNKWLQQFKPAIINAETTLKDQQPVLQKFTEKCQVLEDKGSIIIDAQCLKSQTQE